MPCGIHPASNGRAALAALTVQRSMIFSEKRIPLFGIMLEWRKTANSNRTPVKVPAAFQAVPVRLPG
jgi:hypothetical protein